MSYLHPAYYKLLPPTARPQLIAYLQLVERNAHASADGWADVRQAVIAAELGRDVRSVKRWERACIDVGILVVERGRRHNRRRLRLRSAKEALSANPNPPSSTLREWGHGCHHRGDTAVPTVDNSHHYPRARSDRGDLLRSQTPKPALPAEGGKAAPARPRNGRADYPVRLTVKATTGLATSLELHPRWMAKIAGLAAQLARDDDDRAAAGYLEIIRQRVGGKVDPFARAKGVIAMLEARLRKVREKRRR